jgi:uroporphyrinogen-III synthase
MKLAVTKVSPQLNTKALLTNQVAQSLNGSLKKIPVNSILIAQPKPESDKNPYTDLARKHRLVIDFKPFVHLEGVSAKEFRKLKINPADYAAVVFTSRSAVDQYFKLIDDLRAKISPDGKYYCMTEAIALYLQKYILYRKRKVFFSDGTLKGMIEIIEKHRTGEKFLIPVSDTHKSDIAEYLKKKRYEYADAVIFKTVAAELSEKELRKYDMLILFSPGGVQALLQNFADFKQKNLKIGAFGPLTAQAVISAGLSLDLQAPAPGAPSMIMAIDSYLSRS